MPWFVGSDQLVTIEGLRDPATNAYVNTATIEVTMTDAEGTAVAGQTFPLLLDYISSSNGNYQGLLEDTRELVDGQLYWLEITANAGGLVKTWKWADVARYRKQTDA
jgi:hypothetical protein